MTNIPQEMRERVLASKLVDAEKEVKKKVDPNDMAAIEAELQQEHEQLMKERKEEVAALRDHIKKLDTLVTELQLQQQQQQQSFLAKLLSCNCNARADDQSTERAFDAPQKNS
ncbi:hypothetical protein, conserved [Eimeria tenella]|uniref:Uncharacterized protein n=1 Tax=Eimeria tenella TaxID=5802 RepID=U6KLT2_EIMTE|nr:hypothetical protein, conserved [Eimeria tenella]CDJ37252.1 hypothetical protein, conserved [Eimeria tenella]|eukprot:XP_013228090.1 hypothetical protein, conserved [Eimeria tenella]